MESTIVIKVNYGKTLRRFNGRVDAAGKLDISLSGLREKVLSLFSLSPELDLTLTYLDEDGDSVTLVEDADLSDAMTQSLNPLRITAEVNSQKESNNNYSVKSSGNSTPMRSSPRISPMPDLNKKVSEIFRAVPEPLGEALSKLSLDLTSKAAASSPQLPEIVQQFSNLLQSFIVPNSDPSTQSSVLENSSSLPVAKEPEASASDLARPKIFYIPNLNIPLGDDSAKSKAAGKRKVVPKIKIVAAPDSENQPSENEKKVENLFTTPVNNITPFAPETSPVAVEKVNKSGGSGMKVVPPWFKAKEINKPGVGAAITPDPYNVWNQYNNNNAIKNNNSGGSTSAGPPLNQNSAGKCPFSGGPIGNKPAVPYNPFGPRLAPPFINQVAGIFHAGVRCDGCGVHPITGPRFKSKVREDYDLCSICFAETGSEAEYIRLDHPGPYRHHPIRGPCFAPKPWVSPLQQQDLKKVGKPIKTKLDSRFIMDVNVIDGTMMAPLTPFTKIWRMRNNGTIVWPQGTQLLWIGGDRLSASPSAELQIPVDGLAAENELEVAVDFTAPELPGRYVSYWRMATPSGQKFGQRVWVLIQVDASVKDSANNLQSLNLNLPPSTGSVEAIVVDGRLPIIEPNKINSENKAVDGLVPIPESSNKANDDLLEPLVVTSPTQVQEIDFPTNDNLLVSGTTSSPVVVPKTVYYPIVEPNKINSENKTMYYPTVDSSAVPPVMVSAPPLPPVDGGEEEDGVEQVLLRELEEMGFKQLDLNKEILRINEYNFEKSVDDLCGVSEWDPILEELKEMGFCDSEVNKKLLKKNNGSIKDVVMDLISGEKA